MPKVSTVELMAGLVAALKDGPMSRPKMMEVLDMPPDAYPSINRYLSAYERKGVVEVTGHSERKPGDIGPTCVMFGLKK